MKSQKLRRLSGAHLISSMYLKGRTMRGCSGSKGFRMRKGRPFLVYYVQKKAKLAVGLMVILR